MSCELSALIRDGVLPPTAMSDIAASLRFLSGDELSAASAAAVTIGALRLKQIQLKGGCLGALVREQPPLTVAAAAAAVASGVAQRVAAGDLRLVSAAAMVASDAPELQALRGVVPPAMTADALQTWAQQSPGQPAPFSVSTPAQVSFLRRAAAFTYNSLAMRAGAAALALEYGSQIAALAALRAGCAGDDFTVHGAGKYHVLTAPALRPAHMLAYRLRNGGFNDAARINSHQALSDWCGMVQEVAATFQRLDFAAATLLLTMYKSPLRAIRTGRPEATLGDILDKLAAVDRPILIGRGRQRTLWEVSQSAAAAIEKRVQWLNWAASAVPAIAQEWVASGEGQLLQCAAWVPSLSGNGAPWFKEQCITDEVDDWSFRSPQQVADALAAAAEAADKGGTIYTPLGAPYFTGSAAACAGLADLAEPILMAAVDSDSAAAIAGLRGAQRLAASEAVGLWMRGNSQRDGRMSPARAWDALRAAAQANPLLSTAEEELSRRDLPLDIPPPAPAPSSWAAWIGAGALAGVAALLLLGAQYRQQHTPRVTVTAQLPPRHNWLGARSAPASPADLP